MCTSFLSVNDRKDYPLVLVFNRDEFHQRPTKYLHHWEQPIGILAGRDLESNGTWLGVSEKGKIALVTNHRNFRVPMLKNAPSRGELITNFLINDQSPEETIFRIKERSKLYNGFNLILGSDNEMRYFSNVSEQEEQVRGGVHGISNAFLDTPWPKVEDGGNAFKSLVQADELDIEKLFQLMRSEEVKEDHRLPDTGGGLEFERKASPLFINDPVYGTRSTSVIVRNLQGQYTFYERSFDATGVLKNEEEKTLLI